MSTTPPVFTDSTECNNYVKKLFVENNVEPKKTFWGFVWGELIALIAQVMVFGSAFALTSNFFDDKEKAVQIFSEKIGGSSLTELGMVGLGILLVIGILAVVAKGHPPAQNFIDDFVFEIPRAIYAFGASSTAACACLALYMRGHPAENFGASIPDVVSIAVGLLTVSFLYGCGLSYVFKRSKLK